MNFLIRFDNVSKWIYKEFAIPAWMSQVCPQEDPHPHAKLSDLTLVNNRPNPTGPRLIRLRNMQNSSLLKKKKERLFYNTVKPLRSSFTVAS